LLKGPETDLKGSPRGPHQEVHQGRTPVPYFVRPRDGVARLPIHASRSTRTPADLTAVEDELDAKLDLDIAELATVDGMLQRGAHPVAAANKILKDRGGAHTAGELIDTLVADLHPGDAA
jgi:hypothetical protein